MVSTGDLAAVTVAVVDDHPVVIDGIESWIARDPQRRVRLIASGAALEDVLDVDADVLVLDLNLAGVPMLDRVGELASAGRRVVVFSQDTAELTILSAIASGACAYLAKHEGGEHFVETVIAVAQDRPYVTPSTAGAMWADESAERPALSAQERTALLLWFQGMSKASVASRMSLSVHTVNQYINRARVKYAKAGRPGPTKAALLARAIEDALISPAEVGQYRSYAQRRTA